MTKRIGILGFAHGHVNSYCNQWRSNPDLGIEVTCGWDYNEARLARAVEVQGIKGVKSVEELLSDVDAVVIASETSLHAELVEKAADAGKAIALQKPMAITMAEADRIVDAVNRNNVPFTMAWQMRVDPQNQKMRDLLEADTLGQVFMVRRRHGLPFLFNEGAADSWHTQEKWNRDLWADDSAHPIDFIYWLLGMPKSVTAEIETLYNPATPMDNGITIFRYEGGPMAEVCCSFVNHAGENTTEIVGEKGSIIQNYGDVPSCNVPRLPDAVGLKWYLHEEGRWTYSDIPTPPGHGHRLAGLAAPLAAFFTDEGPAIATAEEGRDALKMVLATYVSSHEGRRVMMDDEAISQV